MKQQILLLNNHQQKAQLLKKGDTLTVVISKGKGERVVSRQFTIPYEAKKTNNNNNNAN